MFKRMRVFPPFVFLAAALAAGAVLAAGAGQEDLDKATEAKLAAQSPTLDDLGEIVRLTESAMKKGLDEPGTEFAKRLLASTFLQRAQEATRRIFANVSSIEDFQKRRKAAVADVEKSLQMDPNQAQAHLLLAQLNALPGGKDPKAVVASLDKAIEFGAGDVETKAKAYLLRAALQDQPEKKRADLDEAVRLLPNNAAMVRARGLALADMDKPEAALADLDRAIALEPDNGPTHEARAIVLARLKRFDEALAALDKVQAISPDSLAPNMQRAKIHAQQRKFDAAIDDLNKALKMDSGNVVVLLLRAGVYQEKGDKQKALADADEAMRLKPDVPLVIRTRALLLAESERLDEAIADLEKLVKLEPKDSLTLLQLGMLYSAKKQSARAVEIFTKLVALEPNEWRAWRGRGDAYLNIGRQAEALADYEKAFKLEPKDDGVLNNLAWLLATSPDDKLRDGRRAVKLATEACELSQWKAAHILSTLAAAYAETGDFDAAVKWSQKAVDLGAKEKDKETEEALKKELENYKAKKPTRELLSEKPAEKKADKK